MDRCVPAGLLALLVVAGGGLLVACSGPRSDGDEVGRSPEEAIHYVQLQMTEDRATADSALTAAVEWWEREQEDLPSPRLTNRASPLNIDWRAPLYRIRLGPYDARSRAEAVLEAAEKSFPEAFIARGHVSQDARP